MPTFLVGESGMIRRRVEADIAHGDAAAQRHAEGLNRAIEVLVVDRVLVMLDAADRAGHFVGDEGAAIDSGRRLDLLIVAPVQALIAGFVAPSLPTGEKLKLVVPPTLKRR